MGEGHGGRRIVGYWFLGTSALVFGIVVLGGLTRLTESGLSMVDWSLVHFRSPSTEDAWQEYFSKYQQYPEYQQNNRTMTLQEFKRIYWFEHAHRVYGRILGMFVILPSILFLTRRWVSSPGMRNVLFGCCALVSFQGALGWYMVRSGLREEILEKGEPARVSQYRLAAHLGSAFALYLICLASGIRILSPSTPLLLSTSHSAIALKLAKLRPAIHRTATLTLLTALSGAFVAGLDAGMIYNSFPLMGDRLIPSDIWQRERSWKNLTENPTTVQFIHRCLAISTIVSVSAVWYSSRKLGLPKPLHRAVNLLAGVAWAQGTLGVLTLLYVVPIPLASAHQAGSLTLLSVFVWLLSQLKRLPK